MDILTLVLACSLHLDDALVTALIHQVSDDNPLLVGDLVTLDTHDHLTSIAEAKAAVADILKRGGRPAVGLMGIPISWAARFGHSPDDLFDACTNIAIGSAVLSEYAHGCESRHAIKNATRFSHRRPARHLTHQRECVLKHLSDDLGPRGYVQTIMEEIANLAKQPPDPMADPPAAQSPILIDSADAADRPPPHTPVNASRTPQPPSPTAQTSDSTTNAPRSGHAGSSAGKDTAVIPRRRP